VRIARPRRRRSAEFAAKKYGIVTKKKTGSASVHDRGKFASQASHFDSRNPFHLAYPQKNKKSLPTFHLSGKPGRINPRKKSVDAFLLF